MNKRTENRILIAIAIVLIAGLVGFFIYRANIKFNGELTEIANLKEYTKGRPRNKDTEAFIKHELYQIIKDNNADLNPKSVKDARIRNDSFKQTDNDDSGLHQVEFLLDIESLKQTYNVHYEWNTKNPDDISEWGSLVTCPKTSDLIFGDFNCQDMFNIMAGSSDPAMRVLPYTDYDTGFEITAREQEDKVQINVYLYTCDESAVEKLKSSATDWLKSQDLNLDNYQITYSSC